jgi:hypothetical protein
MKKALIYLIIIFYLSACDPQPKYAQFEGTTTVKAQVINSKDTIGVNDTVKIRITLPDTIIYNGTNVGLYYDDIASYIGLDLKKFDPLIAGAKYRFAYNYGSIAIPTIGRFSNNGLLLFQRFGNSLVGEYGFIPKSKGIFFIDQPFEGELYANNGQYHLKFTFNYGNINRNHKILLDSIGAGTNFNLLLQDRINNGLEVYGFVVK